MKGVIYARYSSSNQREESIEGQVRECKEFAEKNDIQLLEIYADRAYSAKSDNRPEFQKMIADAKKKMFDVIIVWKLDRFSRNRNDSGMYKYILERNGIKVISATEKISDGSEGILYQALLEGMAEYYSAELSEKVVRGQTENARKGKHFAGSVPLGFQLDKEQYYHIDEALAPVVLEVFRGYNDGMSMKKLADDLSSRGIRTCKGKEITINVIERMLKNRKYIGELEHRGIVYPDVIPQIVPNDLFDAVQEKRKRNKKKPASRKAEDTYLLTTKLFCGRCEAFMVGESGTSHTGTVYHYYKCVTAKKKKGCKKKSVPKDWIEDLVVYHTMQMLMDDALMENLIDYIFGLQQQESTQLPLLKKQLADAEKKIKNILNAIEEGIFTSSTKQRLDELEEWKSQLEISIAKEELQKECYTRENLSCFIYRFRKLDLTEQRGRQILIDSFVNAVYVFDDRVILTFNYKDGSKTISLDEIKGSDLTALSAVMRRDHREIDGLFLFFLQFPTKVIC